MSPTTALLLLLGVCAALWVACRLIDAYWDAADATARDEADAAHAAEVARIHRDNTTAFDKLGRTR